MGNRLSVFAVQVDAVAFAPCVPEIEIDKVRGVLVEVDADGLGTLHRLFLPAIQLDFAFNRNHDLLGV